jgi:cyclopropane fatty-acyl-phospholipid synthase-like methyltransferase
VKKELSFEFIKENMMGPSSVRILEELCRDLKFMPDTRILDLGCGKGLTSIFLAEEFGVQVFATDLWITATENYRRFRECGLEDRVFPIHANALELPYAEEFFDGIVSIDSYHYFGTGEDFVGKHLAPLVKKGGFIAVAVPGLRQEFEGGIVPPELAPYWVEDMNFHSADWWKELWSRESSIEILHSRSMDCHKQAWEDWLKCDNPYAKSDIGFIAADNGRYIDTVEIIARVK